MVRSSDLTRLRSNHDRIEIAALAIVALACRLAWVVRAPPISGDAPEYLQLAHWIAARHLFSYDGVALSSYRPPLYPAFLAVCSFISTNPLLTARLLQCIAGMCTVMFAYCACRRLFDRRTARIAAAIICVAPMTGYFAGAILTETLFTFSLLAGVWAWSDERPALAGAGFAAAAVTRAVLFPFIVLVGTAGALTWRSRDGRRAAILAVVALALIAPWIARNASQLGRITVADAGWGANLLYGTIDVPTGRNRWAVINEELASLAASGTPVASEETAHAVAVSRIRGEPWRWLLTRGRQYPWLFVDSGDYLPVQSNSVAFHDAWRTRRLDTIALKLGFVAGNVLLVIAAVYGAWVSRRRVVALAPLWSFPVFLALAQIPMYAEPRYGLPLVPFLAIFAAAGIRPHLRQIVT